MPKANDNPSTDLNRTVDRVRKTRERVIVRRNGRAAVAIVPISDLRLIEAIEDSIDLAEATHILANAKAGDFVPLEKAFPRRGR